MYIFNLFTTNEVSPNKKNDLKAKVSNIGGGFKLILFFRTSTQITYKPYHFINVKCKLLNI